MIHALRAVAVASVKSSFSAMSPIQKDFTQRIPVEFTKGHFTVKTIDSRRELWQVYKLRYEVFHREYKNKKFPFGLDKDRYDQWADHLAIIDNRLGKIVGTYRLICESVSRDFYSASEFDLSTLQHYTGTKVELSRACIHKSYRTGSVITLLWRGICDYVVAANARWLFGMGSVKTTKPEEIAAIFKYLKHSGAVDELLHVPAVGKYKIPNFASLCAAAEVNEELSEKVPPLLKSYLRAGAIIGSEPAVDLDFNCGDLFVLLDMTKVTAAYAKRFQVH